MLLDGASSITLMGPGQPHWSKCLVPPYVRWGWFIRIHLWMVYYIESLHLTAIKHSFISPKKTTLKNTPVSTFHLLKKVSGDRCYSIPSSKFLFHRLATPCYFDWRRRCKPNGWNCEEIPGGSSKTGEDEKESVSSSVARSEWWWFRTGATNPKSKEATVGGGSEG